MSQSYSISELAREFDVTTRTIRFYEDKQLLHPTREGSTRIYSRTDRTRLRLILRGKRLGWQLNEIREIIELYDTRSGDGEKKQLEAMVHQLNRTREKLLDKQHDILESLADISELESNCFNQLKALQPAVANAELAHVEPSEPPQSAAAPAAKQVSTHNDSNVADNHSSLIESKQ